MSTDSAHRLMLGRMGHHRHGPERHGFTYPVFFLAFDVDALDAALPERDGMRPLAGTSTQASRTAGSGSALCAINGLNLLSIRHRDHGARDGSALGPWLRRVLLEAGLPASTGTRVTLHTFPRVLGMGFSPVSFWLCRDDSGALCALLAEVNNTFGEHHSYLVAHPDGRAIQADEPLTARKIFHVSPFFPVRGDYQFHVRHGSHGLQVRISYRDGKGRGLHAYLQGSAHPFSSGRLLAAWLQHPLQTLSILSRIHWHALLLWRKGVRFHPKPVPPSKEISIERS